MSDIATRDAELNQMILEGKALEAFEAFYAEDIVMLENDEPTKGKDANREREKQFWASITEVHGAGITSSAVGDGVSFCEMWFEASYQGGHRAKLEEVCVRHWKDGQVVKERFYYKGS